MPTESQYRAEAARVGGHSDSAEAMVRSLGTVISDPGLHGGQAHELTSEALDTINETIERLGVCLNQLRHELLLRAEMCGVYTSQMRWWRAEMRAWAQRRREAAAMQAIGASYQPPEPRPNQPCRPFPEASEG